MKGKNVSFLYLNEEDMIRAGVLDMPRCVETTEEVFRLLGKGDYRMGGPLGNEHGQMLWFPEKSPFPGMPLAGPDRRFMSMIAYLGGRFNVCGEKWYGSNVENPGKRGLPRSILMVVLNDPETSEPLAIMSGNLISAMRTGAVPGVAARHLARRDADTVAIIGTGVINRACLLAISTALPGIRQVRLHDIRTEQMERFIDEMSKELEVAFTPCSTPEEAISGSDVVSVATSGIHPVEIRGEWLKENALIELTGVADMSPDLYLESTLVADNWKMHQSWMTEGEEHPDGIASILGWAPSAPVIRLILDNRLRHENIQNLGEIVNGRKFEKRSETAPTIFITGGMPVEDVGWGYTIYKEAREKGIGQELALWESPHWF